MIMVSSNENTSGDTTGGDNTSGDDNTTTGDDTDVVTGVVVSVAVPLRHLCY